MFAIALGGFGLLAWNLWQDAASPSWLLGGSVKVGGVAMLAETIAQYWKRHRGIALATVAMLLVMYVAGDHLVDAYRHSSVWSTNPGGLVWALGAATAALLWWSYVEDALARSSRATSKLAPSEGLIEQRPLE